MQRTVRLFEIMQLFRAGRLWRGCDIAERLEVSLRTIYRDINTLIASGVPIEGERGVGYILREPIFLPPLALTPDELEVLHFGMKIVQQTAGNEMAETAGQLLAKIDAVLPTNHQGRNHLKNLSVFAPTPKHQLAHLANMQTAIAGRLIVEINYERLDGKSSIRHIRPLQCEYWSDVWTCTAWCELRSDFRVFRIDRILLCRQTGDVFAVEPGKTYKDYLANLKFADIAD